MPENVRNPREMVMNSWKGVFEILKSKSWKWNMLSSWKRAFSPNGLSPRLHCTKLEYLWISSFPSLKMEYLAVAEILKSWWNPKKFMKSSTRILRRNSGDITRRPSPPSRRTARAEAAAGASGWSSPGVEPRLESAFGEDETRNGGFHDFNGGWMVDFMIFMVVELGFNGGFDDLNGAWIGVDMVSWIFMGIIMVRTVMGVNLAGIEPSWDFPGDV